MFRDILSMTGEGKALETFNQAVRAQLDELCLLGRLPDVLDVAIDMHLIPCHSKKLGSDLRGGERKSGTNRFEAYIGAVRQLQIPAYPCGPIHGQVLIRARIPA